MPSHLASSVFLSCSFTEQSRSGPLGCLASIKAKASGRLDVYTQNKQGKRLLNQRAKVSVGFLYPNLVEYQRCCVPVRSSRRHCQFERRQLGS